VGGAPEYVVGLGCEGLDALCGSLDDDGLDPDGPATAVGARGDAVVAILTWQVIREANPRTGGDY